MRRAVRPAYQVAEKLRRLYWFAFRPRIVEARWFPRQGLPEFRGSAVDKVVAMLAGQTTS